MSASASKQDRVWAWRGAITGSGFSHREIADAVDLTSSQLSNVLRGQNAPGVNVVIQMALAAGQSDVEALAVWLAESPTHVANRYGIRGRGQKALRGTRRPRTLHPRFRPERGWDWRAAMLRVLDDASLGDLDDATPQAVAHPQRVLAKIDGPATPGWTAPEPTPGERLDAMAIEALDLGAIEAFHQLRHRATLEHRALHGPELPGHPDLDQDGRPR